MKIEELRIGNWVEDCYSGEPVQVYAVGRAGQNRYKYDHIFTSTEDSCILSDDEDQYIRPILITEERLQSFLFLYDDESGVLYKPFPAGAYGVTHYLGGMMYGDSGFLFSVFEVAPHDKIRPCIDKCADEIRTIKHIHELQNLFYALTGKEL